MYSPCMGGKTKKARLNLTIDPDIYRAARRRFNVMDLNMSAFIEQQLATFLQLTEPFAPLLDDVEAGKVDPAALKSAVRSFNATGMTLIGEHLATFGQLQQEIQEFTEGKEHTDKK